MRLFESFLIFSPQAQAQCEAGIFCQRVLKRSEAAHGLAIASFFVIRNHRVLQGVGLLGLLQYVQVGGGVSFVTIRLFCIHRISLINTRMFFICYCMVIEQGFCCVVHRVAALLWLRLMVGALFNSSYRKIVGLYILNPNDTVIIVQPIGIRLVFSRRYCWCCHNAIRKIIILDLSVKLNFYFLPQCWASSIDGFLSFLLSLGIFVSMRIMSSSKRIFLCKQHVYEVQD